MTKQTLIDEVLTLGKKLGVRKELTVLQLNKLKENNLKFIIKLRSKTLEKRSIA